MEVGSREEACRNVPAEPGRAEKGRRCSPPDALPRRARVAGRSAGGEARRWRRVERAGAQILDGVALLGAKGRRGEGFPAERAGPKRRRPRREGEEKATHRRQRGARLDAGARRAQEGILGRGAWTRGAAKGQGRRAAAGEKRRARAGARTETAAGLRGAQPLARDSAGKGIRQNRRVTSGEALALACQNRNARGVRLSNKNIASRSPGG